jgi:hypothetical protein
MLGAEDFTIEFTIGQPVELSLAHLVDILNTCVFLRADIEEKLGCSSPERGRCAEPNGLSGSF